MKKFKFQKKITVLCSKCKERHDEQDVEFLNIEEDLWGRDVLTFKCPSCKATSKSLRFG